MEATTPCPAAQTSGNNGRTPSVCTSVTASCLASAPQQSLLQKNKGMLGKTARPREIQARTQLSNVGLPEHGSAVVLTLRASTYCSDLAEWSRTPGDSRSEQELELLLLP